MIAEAVLAHSLAGPRVALGERIQDLGRAVLAESRAGVEHLARPVRSWRRFTACHACGVPRECSAGVLAQTSAP